MGPQPNSCGNAEHPESQSSALSLQWGHSQTAVETCNRDGIPDVGLCASMGPQPNSCGNRAGLRHDRAVRRASMGPQPNSCGNEHSVSVGPAAEWRLQWGHSQTAVETVELTEAQLDSLAELQWGHSQTAVETAIVVDGPITPPSFNGATAKQLWKRSVSRVLCPGQYTASMGPQPNSCGNQLNGNILFDTSVCFNGATAKQLWKRTFADDTGGSGPLLQWGHSQTAVETRFHRDWVPVGQPSFNGATAKQLWKPVKRAAKRGLITVELQWGHSQTAVETVE